MGWFFKSRQDALERAQWDGYADRLHLQHGDQTLWDTTYKNDPEARGAYWRGRGGDTPETTDNNKF